ncbi:MAG TPA: hypothetical protein VGJ77_11955 [Gaiellaceae bacterium]|jgi:hypothetical protein
MGGFQLRSREHLTRIIDAGGRRRRRGLLVLLPFALLAAIAFAISGSAVATTGSCANTATLAGSAFEIDTDANLKVDTTGCIDWLSDGSGSGFRSGVLAKNDSPSGASDESFGQGTSEDNPNPTVVNGSIPPNKSDLKAFGVYTETAFLELFWSRVQNPSGTTNMDFELNQEFCDGTAAHCANNGTKTPVYITPKRTSGDKLITYDLSKGGTVPTISIRTWTGSAWGPADVISGGSSPDALGSVNTSLIPAAETGGATGGLTTALGSQDPYTFGEAAITFEALFGSGACGTFGSAYLKSRSSDSFTAEIKDFVPPEPVRISNCPSGLTTTATASVTVGNPISDTAHLTAGPGAGGTITFHLFASLDDCNAGTNEINTGLSPVTVNGPGDYNSGNYTPTATGTYYWTAAYSGDPNNDSSSTACGDANESSVVNPIQSTISTHQSVYPNDSATIGGGGGGTVHFRLYAGVTCSGTALVDETTNVVGGAAATANTTVAVDASGTYSWLVEYSGDATHTGATSSCSTEHFAVTFTNG